MIDIALCLDHVREMNNFISQEVRCHQQSNNKSLIAQQDQVQSVKATGTGTSSEEAAQNAAKNALSMVVGTFIDSETLLKKSSVISNGIRKSVKNISTDTKEYSQGSIKSFNILRVSTRSDGLFEVQADVSVRILEFRAYVKQLAADEVTLDKSLFAQISTEIDNESSAINILTEKLRPLAEAEVLKIRLGGAKRCSDDDFETFKINYAFICKRTVLIPVEIFVDKDYLSNLTYTLNELSSHIVDIGVEKWGQRLHSPKSREFTIGIQDFNGTRTIFTIPSIQKALEAEPAYREHPLNSWKYGGYKLFSTDTSMWNPLSLRLQLKDRNDTPFVTKTFKKLTDRGPNKENNRAIGLYDLCIWNETYQKKFYESPHICDSGTGLLNLYDGNVVYASKTLMLVMQLTVDDFKKLNSVEIKYTPVER